MVIFVVQYRQRHPAVIIVLVDDASQYMWLKVLSSKDGALAAIKQYKVAAEVETGHKL
jgi:hypothetical protein